MRPHGQLPRVHFFVCVNERSAGDPLGVGCGERGAAVYARLKNEVAQRSLHASVWVTRTLCLGVCPRQGCTVAIYPKGDLLRDVVEDDVPSLVAEAFDVT